MKVLKWAAIIFGGLFGLLVVIGMLIPDEYAERVREDRRQQETDQDEAASGAAAQTAAAAGAASPSGSDTSRSLTAAQRNAVRSANAYLKLSGFSRRGLIDQLSSEFGDKFSVADATVAVDSLNTNWNTQAARSAASYLKVSGFSCRGLIDQLSSEHGDKYTVEQATYGATQAGIC
jgi:hypothetical protein